MNLLHVVSRRLLHVAFQSSRTLDLKIETLRPPDTSHDIHGKRGGSMKGGKKRERMAEKGGGILSSSHNAMTSEI